MESQLLMILLCSASFVIHSAHFLQFSVLFANHHVYASIMSMLLLFVVARLNINLTLFTIVISFHQPAEQRRLTWLKSEYFRRQQCSWRHRGVHRGSLSAPSCTLWYIEVQENHGNNRCSCTRRDIQIYNTSDPGAISAGGFWDSFCRAAAWSGSGEETKRKQKKDIKVSREQVW